MANVISRSLHDIGLAAWFGGTLANAVALNPAAGAASNPRDSGAVTNAGWSKWTPVNAAAIGLHLVGGAGVLLGNKGRVVGQRNVGTMTIIKTALTGGALAATGWARLLGNKVAEKSNVPVADGTTPNPATPSDVADAQRQLNIMQWAIPALTGGILIVSALAGEQQRPTNVVSGLLGKITG